MDRPHLAQKLGMQYAAGLLPLGEQKGMLLTHEPFNMAISSTVADYLHLCFAQAALAGLCGYIDYTCKPAWALPEVSLHIAATARAAQPHLFPTGQVVISSHRGCQYAI